MSTYERREVTDGVRAALGRLDTEDRRVLLLLTGDSTHSYRDVSVQVRRPVGSLGPTRQRLLAAPAGGPGGASPASGRLTATTAG